GCPGAGPGTAARAADLVPPDRAGCPDAGPGVPGGGRPAVVRCAGRDHRPDRAGRVEHADPAGTRGARRPRPGGPRPAGPLCCGRWRASEVWWRAHGRDGGTIRGMKPGNAPLSSALARAVDLSALKARATAPPAPAGQPGATQANGAGGRPHVIDVTEQTFQTEVLERSMRTPVVLDLRADWCG